MTSHISTLYSMVVPYGDDLDSLAAALKEFPTGKVIAVVPSRTLSGVIANVRSYLAKRGIPFELRTVTNDAADGFFLELEKVKESETNPIVNVSVGSGFCSYLLLCAAMATGVTAFGFFDGELAFLPISCSLSHGK